VTDNNKEGGLSSYMVIIILSYDDRHEKEAHGIVVGKCNSLRLADLRSRVLELSSRVLEF